VRKNRLKVVVVERRNPFVGEGLRLDFSHGMISSHGAERVRARSPGHLGDCGPAL